VFRAPPNREGRAGAAPVLFTPGGGESGYNRARPEEFPTLCTPVRRGAPANPLPDRRTRTLRDVQVYPAVSSSGMPSSRSEKNDGSGRFPNRVQTKWIRRFLTPLHSTCGSQKQ